MIVAHRESHFWETNVVADANAEFYAVLVVKTCYRIAGGQGFALLERDLTWNVDVEEVSFAVFREHVSLAVQRETRVIKRVRKFWRF